MKLATVLCDQMKARGNRYSNYPSLRRLENTEDSLHREPKHFVACVKKQYPEFFTGKKVLEVGSLDINGSVREFFTDCAYIGIDLGEGDGVDKVVNIVDFPGRNEYDVVISTETLEHDKQWVSSLHAMYDLLQPNGLLVITCAAPNRPEHGTTRTGSADASPFTADYYRNISVEDFASILPANLFFGSYLGYRGNMDDLYFAGIKKAPIKLVDSGIGRDLIEPRGGATGTISVDAESKSATVNLISPKSLTVTAEVSTKGRYTTTLPMTLAAILMQTRKPEKLVIYDDGEQKDLRELPPFDGLLRLTTDLGIEWTFFSTERKGQVANHQHALDNTTTDLIWRIDDDQIPEPNCLENLLTMMTDDVGAVGGLVHHPGGVFPLPPDVNGTLADIAHETNVQWFSWTNAWKEVEHLYSTFLYSVEAARKAGGYPRELSVIGHREESWFSIAIRRAGYKLIVTPYAKTWHLRQSQGGIRSFPDTSLWEHDELIFQEYLKTVGQVSGNEKLIVADMGLGDHLLLRALLIDEFSRKYPDRKWTIACCYPETMEDIPNVKIISVADAKLLVGDRYPEFSLYQYCWDNDKHNQPLVQSMREFWG